MITAKDVFSKYMFAQPITSPSAKTVAKILMQWFSRHSYVFRYIWNPNRQKFTVHIKTNSIVSEMLELKLNHATVKHA